MLDLLECAPPPPPPEQSKLILSDFVLIARSRDFLVISKKGTATDAGFRVRGFGSLG